MFVVDQLRQRAQAEPERVALTFIDDEGTRELTYGALVSEGERIAARLRAELPHARRAMLLHRPGPEFVAALCACWFAGLTPIPTYPPSYRLGSRASGRFERLVADADPQVILIDGATLPRAWRSAASGGLAGVRWLATDKTDAPRGSGPVLAVENTGPDGTVPALIQYTSGSTGNPRGVCLSHANLAENLVATAQRLGLRAEDCIVSWLPPYHDMGLIGGILPMLAFGCHLVQMAPASFVARPRRWLEAISTYRARFSGGPNFAYELCAQKLQQDEMAGLDLSHWQVAFCGAETVRPATLRRFAGLTSGAGFDAAALLPCYGLAEATLMVTAGQPGTGVRSEAAEGAERTSCGPAAQGVLLAIVNAEGTRCADGTAGEVWLAGAAVSCGYWRKDEINARQFGQTLSGSAERWMRTGDMGYLRDGDLVITGRLKDLIILRGRNVYPADLEDAAAGSHPAIDPLGVAAFSVEGTAGEDLVLACELRRDSRRADPVQVERAVQGALADILDVRASAIVLVRPGTLPRTTSGKISRSAARDAWLAGEMAGKMAPDLADAMQLPSRAMATAVPGPADEVAAAPTPVLTPAALTACAARIAGKPTDQVDMDWTLGELGIDSLKQVELLLTLEYELGMTVPPDRLGADMALRELHTLLVPATPVQARILPPLLPPSPQQLALLDAGVADPHGFLEIVYLRVPPAPSRSALDGALAWLAQRHPALQLRFARNGDGNDGGTAAGCTWQAFAHAAPFQLERLGSEHAGATAAGWRHGLLARVKGAIHIEQGALAHAVWLDRGPLENGVLVLALHHLIVDAVSVSILVAELQQAYRRLAAGESLPLPAPDGYADWLVAQAARDEASLAAELEFWRDVCGPRQENAPIAAGRLESAAQVRLAPEYNRAFLERFSDSAARRDALLAAFAHAWMVESGESSALVRLEHHGRSVATTGAVGWLISFYPLRIDGGNVAGEAVADVQRAHAALPAQGAGYALLRHGAVPAAIREQMLTLRDPQLAMSYRGAVDEAFRRDDLFPVIGVDHQGADAFQQARAHHGVLPMLDLQASLVGGTLVCNFLHLATLLPAERVRAVASRMEAFMVRLAGD